MHPWSRQVIERTPDRARRPVALTVRLADAAIRDRLPGLAAEIAFWVLLSLPAMLLTGIAAASVFGAADGADWQQQLVDRVAEVSRVALTSGTVDDLVRPILESLLEDGGPGLVSTAAIATVWTASRAVRVVLTALSIVYGRGTDRPGWQDRLLGFAITLGGLLLGVVVAPLLVAGPAFGETLQGWTTLDLSPLPGIWRSLYWPTTVLLAALTLSLLYHLGVPGRRPWVRALPGAVLATGAWLAGSGGLRLYGQYIAAGDSAYGPLAGPVVFLLWLWLSGFAVLLGGELNAQIDHVWPRGRPRPALKTLTTDVADAPPPDDEELEQQRAAIEETTRPLNAPQEPRS